MLSRLARRATAPIRRPLSGLKSALAGLPLDEVRSLAGSPADLFGLARLQMGFLGFRYVMPVLLARETGVFGQLDEAPLRLEELSRRCELHPQAVLTLMRVLESQGLVSVEGEQVALTQLAARFLGDKPSHSLLPVVDLLRSYAREFGGMASCLRTGEMPPGLDVRRDDATTDALLDAVNTHMAQVAPEFFSRVQLPMTRRAIVGSMGVSFSSELLRHAPQARITYGCLPHLVERIPRLRREYDVDPMRVDGMHSHSGDPHADAWGDETFDLVFLTRKMILEPDRNTGQKFAEKAFEVLEPGGVAVFWEAIHPDRGPSPLPLAMETVFDLGMSPSAPLKTRSQFSSKLRSIGYSRIEYVACLGGSTTFAVARKDRV